MKRSTEYKVRICKNMNLLTKEDCYGIAIMVPGGVRYCKYCFGHQGYSSIKSAEAVKIKIEEHLKQGYTLVYGLDNRPSMGVNRNEYVKICRKDMILGKNDL